MFNAENPSHSHLLRSKRSRQSSANDDSIKQPATKKRRSALRRDTFEPLTDASLNERVAQPNHDSKINGSGPDPSQEPSRTSSRSRDLTIRGGKKHEKRSERGVGLNTLSTHDFYTISQLPALPDQIRSRPTVSYSCVISPEDESILALTHTDALVWSYNTSSSTPASRELHSFKLPFPPAITEDPLPLAAFTSKSANGEPGILVVSPKCGKIAYWETLSSATSYTPSGAHTNAVQGSIPGMFSGELVKDLVPAEPAGFVLTLASGRVAQLTIRDQMGRPGIGVQFMRKSSAAAAAAATATTTTTTTTVKRGFFGTIRNVFGGDRRKGTVIARPGKIARAQRDVVLCTDDADLEFWTNNLLTGNRLTSIASIKDQLLTGIRAQLEADQVQQPVGLKVVDFTTATIPSSDLLVRRDENDIHSLIMLVAVSDNTQTKYYLIEITLAHETAHVRVVHPIRCYSDSINHELNFRPRICLPPASATAFIVFEQAIVIMSLARISESPSSQLTREKDILPQPFQDCIRLVDNAVYRIVNAAAEENESGPSCAFAIQGYGIARIVSHLPNETEVEVEDLVSQVTAKERIEQAVFFGNKQTNPLDLRRSSRNSYSRADIRQAILAISRDILQSKSKHISKSSPSIAEHMQQRARALQDLIDYALKAYSDCLDRADRLVLLWNAERIAAAQALWRVQERIQATYPRKDDRGMSYLNWCLLALSETRQKYPDPEKGETDHVRHWLIHSLSSFGRIMAELEDCMGEMEKLGITDPTILCDYLLEGTELWTAALSAAFKFREDNAAIYGLGNEDFQHGVLKSGYPVDLEIKPWTSTREQVTKGQRYVLNQICPFLRDWFDYVPAQQNGSAHPKSKKSKAVPTNIDGEPYPAPSKASLHELTDRLPHQVELFSRTVLEANIQRRVEILQSQMTPEAKQDRVEQLASELRVITNQAIRAVAPFNRDGTIALAEVQKDTDLLVELNLDYLADLGRKLKTVPDSEHAQLLQKIRKVQDHVETYFQRFGNDWAYSHFSSMIERGELGRLIGEGQPGNGKKQPYINWFFETCAKRDKRLGRVAWINHILGETKFDAASRTLENVAADEESDLWSKKTELCLAKLANLAAQETDGISADGQVEKFDYELEYLRIIESLALHVNTACYDAVDDEAAVQLATDRYIPTSIKTSKKASQIRKSLSATLHNLVTGQTISLHELVDALTLLELGPPAQELGGDVDDVAGQEFSYALQAIDISPNREATSAQRHALRMTVWRRLLIKDNWTELNNTSGKSDQQVKELMQRTVLFLSLLDMCSRADEQNIDVHFPSVDEIVDAAKALVDSDDKQTEDVKAELALLNKYVQKVRLKEHFSGLVKEARDELRRFKDRQGDAQAEEALASPPPVNGINGQVNGHST